MTSILACLALLLTALVPSGYMAAQAEDGALIIRICNGSGGMRQITPDNPLHETFALIQQHSGDAHDSEPADENTPCDMGNSPLAKLGDDHTDLHHQLQSMALEAVVLPILTGIFPRGLPPATGPPIS